MVLLSRTLCFFAQVFAFLGKLETSRITGTEETKKVRKCKCDVSGFNHPMPLFSRFPLQFVNDLFNFFRS